MVRLSSSIRGESSLDLRTSIKGLERQEYSMMRIAIAGSGGLARIFAYHISQTAHQFIILSRTVRGFVS
jgi:shikimate 5-dehydrogenase